MHIPWEWIKQRPHFFAEGLAEKYDITVVCPKTFKKNIINKSFIQKKVLFRLPFERLRVIKYINKILYFIQVIVLARNYDSIWITSPSIFSYRIFKFLNSKKIYYDCMDDMLEFDNIEQGLIKKERKLYQIANIVFCSSEYLAETLKARYGSRNKIFIINNAVNLPDTNCVLIEPKKYFNNYDGIKLVYIGTISKWFDFNLILYIQEKIPTLELFLFGPKDIQIPENRKIHYCGIVEHNAIFSIMNESDILIMPFIVTKLILSVNPVKLYEYIYSGRPCIAPKYPESMKFAEYVYLYNDKEHCLEIINSIITNKFIPQRTKADSLKFIENNTWQKRLLQITNIIDGED